MKIIIPMAGTGNRFVESGYKEPKPLIKVNGKRIIEYILEMFEEEDVVFICNETHLNNTKIYDILKDLKPKSKIISMENHKLGPVYTVKKAYKEIADDEEVIISYCDNPYTWDRSHFNNYVKNSKLDGCILSHTGFHPHTLAETKMAYIKEKNNLVHEIKEKECYTNNPMNEHASTGTYYYSRGEYVKKYFDLALQNNLTYNGEYYVTLVYNLLIKNGLKIGYYDTEFATVMGTPEEVENFEAWANIISKGQVKNEQDLIKCYQYWKKYHENNIC
ncbi:NTP transferase domain-containing protein [Akkermansiaceae bacterium]|nr:NTP transferase domain-containing protein [Akkermansiaceae bacterium]